MGDAATPGLAAPRWAVPDVLIVGAGAAGAAVAWRLAEAGFRVVCLEQGGWVAPESMADYGADWELRRLGDYHPDPNARQLPADYPINVAETPYSPLMFNAVGGSTLHWSAHFPRNHPSDSRSRGRAGRSASRSGGRRRCARPGAAITTQGSPATSTAPA